MGANNLIRTLCGDVWMREQCSSGAKVRQELAIFCVYVSNEWKRPVSVLFELLQKCMKTVSIVKIKFFLTANLVSQKGLVVNINIASVFKDWLLTVIHYHIGFKFP